MLNALIDYRIELNLWIALSILTYAISVNLAWRWRRPRPGRLVSWIEEGKSWLLGGWLFRLLRLAYYVGLPFCLLLNGDAVERSLRRFLGFSIPLGFLMRGVLLPRAMGLAPDPGARVGDPGWSSSRPTGAERESSGFGARLGRAAGA